MSRAGRSAAVGAIALLALWAGVAQAAPEQPHPTFARTPERGMPGTVIHVSGGDCQLDGRAWEEVNIFFFSDAKKADGTPTYHTVSGYYPIKDDGTWAFDYVVPADAPVGDYTMGSYCHASDMSMAGPVLPYTVGEPLPTTTTTSPPEPTTTALVPGATTTTARPAAAVTTTTAVATTTTAPAVPTTPEPAGPGRNIAAPSSDTHPDRGRPWGAAAVAGVLAAGSGTLVIGTARRARRRGVSH